MSLSRFQTHKSNYKIVTLRHHTHTRTFMHVGIILRSYYNLNCCDRKLQRIRHNSYINKIQYTFTYLLFTFSVRNFGITLMFIKFVFCLWSCTKFSLQNWWLLISKKSIISWNVSIELIFGNKKMHNTYLSHPHTLTNTTRKKNLLRRETFPTKVFIMSLAPLWQFHNIPHASWKHSEVLKAHPRRTWVCFRFTPSLCQYLMILSDFFASHKTS